MHRKRGREFITAAVWLLMLGVSVALPSCGGHGSAPVGQVPPASDFILEILDDTYIEGGDATEFKLTSATEGDTILVEITVAGADDLKALICGLSYDPAQFDPVSVDCTGALDPEGGEVVSKTIALDVAPGEVYHGQILPWPAERDGLVGDAVLARAVFLRQADHAAKAVSAPPINRRSQTPLTWDAEAGQLDWYYFNSGDSNQDGDVGVADLTPFGVHWRETSGNGPWPIDTVQSVIDYDNNGELNYADLAALARYFGVWVSGYNVFTSQDAADYPATNDGPNGPGAVSLGFLDLYDSTGGGRRHFTFAVAEPQADAYYWVRPIDGEEAEGTPSTLAGGPE